MFPEVIATCNGFDRRAEKITLEHVTTEEAMNVQPLRGLDVLSNNGDPRNVSDPGSGAGR